MPLPQSFPPSNHLHTVTNQANRIFDTPTDAAAPEIPERIKEKIAKLGQNDREAGKDAGRLETIGRDMANISEGNPRRSEMVILLTEKLESAANSPGHFLNAEHVEHLCRLVLEHTCHIDYRDTVDAQCPEPSNRSNRHHSATLWHAGDDVSLVSDDARISAINMVKNCFSRSDGNRTYLPFTPKIQQYLFTILSSNLERLNKQSVGAEKTSPLHAELKGAALKIIERSREDDEERLQMAAGLFDAALLLVESSPLSQKRGDAIREKLIKQLPSLPSNPRVVEVAKKLEYRRGYYDQKSAHIKIPDLKTRSKRLDDTVIPVYKAALQRLPGQKIKPFKDVIAAHLDSLSLYMRDIILESDSPQRDNVAESVINGFTAFAKEFQRTDLTGDQFEAQIHLLRHCIDESMQTLFESRPSASASEPAA